MNETIEKIEILKSLLRQEVFPGGGTGRNAYGLSTDDEKEIREKLITLIKQI